jgi:hypothetical protein
VWRGIAREALRVLKDDGVRDYRYQPPDEQEARPVKKRQLRELFPDMRIEGHPLHPLPPVLRKIGPYAEFMCNVLAMVPFIRTHYFATNTRR